MSLDSNRRYNISSQHYLVDEREIFLFHVGYEGADCGLVKGQVPSVKYIPNEGMCDINERPCRSVRVVATGVKDSSDLVCRVVEVEVRTAPYCTK